MALFKKPITELQKKYDHAHQLFFIQGQPLFERLERVSQHNLEMFTHFEPLKKTEVLIREQLMVKAKKQLEDLAVSKSNRHDYNALHEAAKLTVDICFHTTEKWFTTLGKVMEQEAELKTLIAEVKEEARLLRSDYFVASGSLIFLESRFANILKSTDETMLSIEQSLEAGAFDKVELTIKKLMKVMRHIRQLMPELPKLCVTITSVIPHKLTELKNAANNLVKQGYPIHHLLVYDTLEKCEDERIRYENQLQNLAIDGLAVAVDHMLDRIDSFYPLFDAERAAKDTFEKMVDPMYEKVNSLEKKFRHFKAELPRVKNSYVLEASKLAMMETIEQHISELNRIKRGLDTLMLASTRQPYSLQTDKLNMLASQSEIAEEMMTAYEHYTKTLKEQANAAYAHIQQFFIELKETEQALMKLYIPSLQEQYVQQFQIFYTHMQDMMNAFKRKPIDMNVIDSHSSSLNGEGKALINQVKQIIIDAQAAETLLVKANALRYKTSDYQRMISLAEQAFFEGKFQLVIQEMTTLLNKILAMNPSSSKQKTR
jgi:septation ring formation regulator EzrA